jgi:hypothetical protein
MKKILRYLLLIVGVVLIAGTAYSERYHIARYLSFSNLTDGSIGSIQLDPTPGDVTCTEGLYYWDEGDRTQALCTDIENVVLQVGQEMFVKVVNKTGVQIDNGKVVLINGAQGNRPTISLADASTEETSEGTLGVVTEDIADNNEGYVTTVGLVRGLNTAAYCAEGDTLYLDTNSGGIVNSSPVSPNHMVRIGTCVVSHSQNGIIFVNVINGEEIGELHDVDYTATSAAVANDILIYNGTTWGASDESLAYGSLFISTPDASIPSAVAVVNGTIDAGNYTSLEFIDQSYLEVSESGQFLINTTVSGLSNPPAQVLIVSRYEGNPAHNILIFAWNYVLEQWIRMTAESNDFPSSGTDGQFIFNWPAISSDYTDSGEAKFQMAHVSAATGSHDFFYDYAVVLGASVTLPDTMTPVVVNSLTEGLTNKTTVDGTLGTITLTNDGVYEVGIDGSFSGDGDTDTIYTLHLYVNDTIDESIGATRGIGSSLPGSFSSPRIKKRYDAGDVLNVKAKADITNTFMSLEHYGFDVLQVGK